MILSSVSEIRDRFQRAKGKRNNLESQCVEHRGKLREAKHRLLTIEKAKSIIDKAAKDTQKHLKDQVVTVVSAALASVYSNPYELELEFGSARGAPEAIATFSRDGETGFDPMEESGLGVVDVASLASRMSVLCMGQGRRFLLLDEPFKHLGRKHHKLAGEMLQDLSKKLGLQVIIVTHSPKLAQSFDRVWDITLVDGKSEVVRKW